MYVFILGVVVGGVDPRKLFRAKTDIFACFGDISSLNDQKNSGVGNPAPGAISPVIFFKFQ